MITWMVTSYTCGLTAQVDWLGLRSDGHLALRQHLSNEPGEPWITHGKAFRWKNGTTGHGQTRPRSIFSTVLATGQERCDLWLSNV